MVDDKREAEVQYPRDLVGWAGHHAGGVKRLFDARSGRPSGELIRTGLILRLEAWVKAIASGIEGTPRILLLVGGPGNGKTEAIEHTIYCLDQGLAAGGRLLAKLAQDFLPPAGHPVPRLVRVDAGSLAASQRSLALEIVQDASVTAGHEGQSAAALLIEELRALVNAPPSCHYLCCVNRGVLDDALIYALDNDLRDVQELLEAITLSVGLSSNAPSCWPLEGFPKIAIWPMDAESLLAIPEGEIAPPAEAVIEHATKPTYWREPGQCPAGASCPFCNSQSLLSREAHRDALLRILRWYELASGKRWSFRDLFSLFSYLLAGFLPNSEGQASDPCAWAARLQALDRAPKVPTRAGRQQLTAIFHLATSGYQHALFHHWNKDAASLLRQDLKDLGLGKDDEAARVLHGLASFLQDRGTPYLPATISPVLDNLAGLLDPAMASPECEVAVSARSSVTLRDLDTRFSRSLGGGIAFIRKYQVLSPHELELLLRLEKADLLLASSIVRRKKPAAASRVQRTIRDFACRLVRRSICVRTGAVADAAIMQSFQQVVEDDHGDQLYEVAQQVKNLLNTRRGFEISLTTTFGQPLPPRQRQAILVVPPQPVRALPLHKEGRPRSPICFLQVGQGRSSQPIALTFDLFKAVKELERGLAPASLPKTVVALLDTTRARLAGPLVRDPDVVGEARIRIGADGVEIGKSWSGFVARKGDQQP
ncbi:MULTISPECIES: hypothetical protein [Cupriavidus]|uniref:hypothetical protein n=1 Tax=Cupriavidus pauculus TaxID=82633 RepID=UPI001C931F94|nr:hypothetical protein [Cupriavidus pauculus]MBY4731763.1 hypothetical protein [Cupriavidus pauculus]